MSVVDNTESETGHTDTFFVSDELLKSHNCEAFSNSEIPHFNTVQFRKMIIAAIQDGANVSAFYAVSIDSSYKIIAILTDRISGQILTGATIINKNTAWESLVKQIPAIHMFEREIAEQYEIPIENHPWLKPVRFEVPFTDTKRKPPVPGVTDFYKIAGEEIHEVAVGPVHAGIIEPGHFRFQCHGEEVFHLEIALGYQHRGIERNLIGGPNGKTVYYMETIAGDTTIGHNIAYCQAYESLTNTMISPRAQAIRGIALELERLANHTGDLGALAQDIGFLPTSAFCGRLRGDFLNMSALICGSRFGRTLVRPGGVSYDIDDERAHELIKRLDSTMKDVENAVGLLWDTSSVLARFDSVGVVSKATAAELGLVGPSARASDIACDIRHDFPDGIYQFYLIPVSTWQSGDVFARAYVRWLEIQQSYAFISELLKMLPQGQLIVPVGPIDVNRTTVALVEGWRGEICHVVSTDKDGKFSRYKIVDPSFHNWNGLAMALRNQQISDFPICNKSFNLSYCGFDL
jgi:Ni,Fe-hydrogenase III large subunit